MIGRKFVRRNSSADSTRMKWQFDLAEGHTAIAQRFQCKFRYPATSNALSSVGQNSIPILVSIAASSYLQR